MAVMIQRRSVFLIAGILAIIFTGTVPALAGFEWMPSGETPPAVVPVSPTLLTSPVSAPSTKTGAGAINWDKSVPQMPVQKVQGIEAIPLSAATEPKKATSAAAVDTVSGFGTDLPLMVALQQVVPQQYKVSLAPGVDGGVHVSWQGERPWQQVLSDMLGPPGLSFSLQGNTLLVKSSTDKKYSASAGMSPHSKADMIPEDMVANNTNVDVSPAELSQPIPMAVRRKDDFMPAQEMAATTPATPVSVPVITSPPSVTQPAWHGARGQTLRAVLEDWSKMAQVKLYWTTDYDYQLNSDVSYNDSYEQAVGKLFNQFSTVKPQPYGQLHRNPETGGVLVVNTYGTSN